MKRPEPTQSHASYRKDIHVFSIGGAQRQQGLTLQNVISLPTTSVGDRCRLHFGT